ncbi:MAG: hypothetical protein GON13_00780 [Nanoarchaeota archaeon]|nr:hypothetical protein [Nanoarchaeota archaeon]
MSVIGIKDAIKAYNNSFNTNSEQTPAQTSNEENFEINDYVKYLVYFNDKIIEDYLTNSNARFLKNDEISYYNKIIDNYPKLKSKGIDLKHLNQILEKLDVNLKKIIEMRSKHIKTLQKRFDQELAQNNLQNIEKNYSKNLELYKKLKEIHSISESPSLEDFEKLLTQLFEKIKKLNNKIIEKEKKNRHSYLYN